MQKIISILQEGRRALQEELKQVDTGIADLEAKTANANPKDNPAIAILMKGRDRLQAQLEHVELVIRNVTQIENGQPLESKVSDTNPDRGIEPGKYAGMKLSTAVQAYLADRGRGPILLARVIQDLITAGVLVGKEHKIPDTRDLRLLCANNRKRFAYDVQADTISLRTSPGNDTGRVSRGRKVVPAARTA